MFCAPLWPQMQPHSTVRKGTMCLQSNGLFARWHQRFFVLTTRFIQCYKLNSNKLTKMGKFIFQVRLSGLTDLDIFERPDGTVVIVMEQDNTTRIYVKSDTEQNTRDWFVDINATLTEAKRNVTNPLVDSLPRSRECLDHHKQSVNNSEEASCNIGPVIRLSLALDQEEDLHKESKGVLKTD
eukprot:GFUD01016641.1.p1 GENE.GFUD01016641.1~~GFUD01016641.1.p1  ORF type:complete len:182 (-),score=39.70 GFUD01016641.1:214-759(-)